MARAAKPWFRPSRQGYFAYVHGRCVRLTQCAEKSQRAERRAVQVLKSLLKETQAQSGGTRSVANVVQKFIDFIYKKKKNTPETADWYFKHLKPFVESVGNLTVSELQTHHIQDWIDSHQKWSDGTKHGAWRAINRAFRWAVKQGHTVRNPAADVEKEPPPRREIVVSEPHYRKILELTKDAEFRDLITVAWECGARAQELLPLEIRHLELERGRAIFPTDEAKGKQRPRYVYFTDDALAIVKLRVGRRQKGKVFLNTDGEPWTPFSVACRFARLQKKLNARYCLTNFRHTWQTRLLQSGIDAITVSHLAGHNGDPSMLAKVYSHLDPEYLRGTLRRASRASGAAGHQTELVASADRF